MDNQIKETINTVNPMEDIYEISYQCIGVDNNIGKVHHDDSVEILQMWSEGGYFVVKNNIFPIIPGAIIIVDAMESHFSNPSCPDTYNRSKIILSRDCFDRLTQLCRLDTLAQKKIFQSGGMMLTLNPASATTREINDLFQRAEMNFPVNQGSPIRQAIIMECVLRILTLTLYLEPDTTDFEAIDSSKTIHLMAKYLNDRLITWDAITMEDLCRDLHISKSHASHLFKRLTNKSLSQYIMELRLSEAKNLLLNTNLSIQNIADTLHFQDSTTFCKTFRKHMQCTPSTYRRSKGLSNHLW